MKRLISYSLYTGPEGHTPKRGRVYWFGALRNIEIAADIYPDWTLRFYIDDTMPKKIIRAIEKGAEVVLKKRHFTHDGKFWRFLPIDDPSVDATLVRECDSFINQKGKAAVDEWLQSGKTLHIMRDPTTQQCISAGRFGIRNSNHKINNISSLINQWFAEKKQCGNKRDIGWISDENFLAKCIYPILKYDCLIHGYPKEGEVLAERQTEIAEDIAHRSLSDEVIVRPFPKGNWGEGGENTETGYQTHFIQDVWVWLNPLTLKPIAIPMTLKRLALNLPKPKWMVKFKYAVLAQHIENKNQ